MDLSEERDPDEPQPPPRRPLYQDSPSPLFNPVPNNPVPNNNSFLDITSDKQTQVYLLELSYILKFLDHDVCVDIPISSRTNTERFETSRFNSIQPW